MLFNSRLLVVLLTLSSVVTAAVAEVQLQQQHLRGLAGKKESSGNNGNNGNSGNNGNNGNNGSNGKDDNGKDENGDNNSNGKHNSSNTGSNNGNSDMDGPVKGPENEPQKQGQGEDCAPGPNHITNAGSNSKGVFFKRTSQSRKLSTTQSIDTSNAFSSYQSQDLYQFARSLQSGLKYMWDNAKYQDSCYDYDIILGFAEIDEEVCKGNKKRIFSVDVNVGGGGPIDIVTDLNVAEKAGGCYKAITVKTTVTPMTKNIDIQFKKSKNSDLDEPMVSFIAIVRQENRRLGSKCDEKVKLLPTV